MEFLLSYESFINNPYDSTINFTIAREYEHINQYAAAISFYMRAAEYATINENRLVYNALLNSANLFLKLGARTTSVKNLVLQASSILPLDPLAYNFLSKVYEVEKNWFECYKACQTGLRFLLRYQPSDLFGSHHITYDQLEQELQFNLATSSYYIGKLEESKIHFAYLDQNKLNCSDWMQQAINRSLDHIKYPVRYNELLQYFSKFKLFIKTGLEDNEVTNIVSYSQCLQDIFVASIIKSKNTSGTNTYIEIGSGDPIHNNNTYLLEKLGWRGISYDIDKNAVEKFNSVRTNSAYVADMTTYNRHNKIEDSKDQYITIEIVDYLQFDCEPPEVTLAVLYNFPFDLTRAKLITFEHDGYRNNDVKEQSRIYLKSKGYELIISDVSFNNKDSFEDWWCNKSIMSKEEYAQCLRYKNIKSYTKSILDIFLN